MPVLKDLVAAAYNIADKAAGCIDPELRSDAAYAVWQAWRIFKPGLGATSIEVFCRLNAMRRVRQTIAIRQRRNVSQIPENYEAVDAGQLSPLNSAIYNEAIHERETAEATRRRGYGRRQRREAHYGRIPA